MKQNLCVLSNGVFYRPVDTPAGKSGWVGEISFYYNRFYTGEKVPNIQQVFDNKEDAEKFVKHEIQKLYENPEYKVTGFKGKLVF